MRTKHWVAIALGVALAAPGHAQSAKAGIEAWQRSDYAGAVAIWKPLAEKGDPDAAYDLAQAYRFGRGVKMSLSDALIWFEVAARKGHVEAQLRLGLLLFQNGNQTAGLRWLKAAAEKGEPQAMLVYGTALFNGDGVPQNPVLGYAYVSRSAAQGLAPAKETLAQLDQILPIEDRRRGVALAIAKSKTTPAPSSKLVKPTKPKATASTQPPVSKPVPKAAPKAAPPASTVAASGTWRIQLGAFSQRGSAEALYRKLSGKAALAGRQAYYVPVGAITRLQAGPFESKAAAAAACRALGVPCFAVSAK
jgi:uncharacterized protein